VADRSRPDSIRLYEQLGLDFKPARKLKSVGNKTEIEQGIDRVNALINSAVNSDPLPKVVLAPIGGPINPEVMHPQVYERGSPFA